MMQMLWMMTIMPYGWKFCHYLIIASSKGSYQEGNRAWSFDSCQEVGYFIQESIEYNLSYHTVWGLHSVEPIFV